MFSPVACFEKGLGASIWIELATQLGIECGENQEGCFIREYRNKVFRAPLWMKAPTLKLRLDAKEEYLWAPERRFLGVWNRRGELSAAEIEEQIRLKLCSQSFKGSESGLKRMEGVPLKGFQVSQGKVKAVLLGSGEEVECEQVIYADRWSYLLEIEGTPKPISFLRNRDPVGILQACFQHNCVMSVGLLESFFLPIHREPGEEIERHIWGYWSGDGKKSYWTLCLTVEEIENNHEIVKKFRRLKTSLDRVFAGSDLIPSGKSDFSSTVQAEQVRFHEELLFSEGQAPTQPLSFPNLEGVHVLTDGYGPTLAMQQVAFMLGIDVKDPNSEAETMNLADSSILEH
jgi:hypothetical protein